MMRNNISLERKLKLIEDARMNRTDDQGQLVQMYNNVQLSKKYDIKRTTVTEILKAKKKILEAAEEGYGPNRKRLKKAVNQGIIENIKVHYKKLLLRERMKKNRRWKTNRSKKDEN